jgi:hypothetical protein
VVERSAFTARMIASHFAAPFARRSVMSQTAIVFLLSLMAWRAQAMCAARFRSAAADAGLPARPPVRQADLHTL